MEAIALPTREHLIATARRLLDADGLELLTLREIARRGGLSHGAPLRHFPSLATLLSAVAAQGFRELFAAVDAAVAEAPPAATPIERLAAAGRGHDACRVWRGGCGGLRPAARAGGSRAGVGLPPPRPHRAARRGGLGLGA